MGCALAYIEKLRGGEPVSFRPRGSSMKGKITATCSATESTAAVRVARLIRSPLSLARKSAHAVIT